MGLLTLDCIARSNGVGIVARVRPGAANFRLGENVCVVKQLDLIKFRR